MLHSKKNFMKGLLLLGSFAVIFIIILSPVFKDNNGKAQTGLEYADDLFNKLSKGSSYFLAEVQEGVDTIKASSVDVTVKPKKADLVPVILTLASQSGLTATDKGNGEIALQGMIAPVLEKIIADSDAFYKNDGAAVKARYNLDEKQVMKAWWEMCSSMIKPLQKQKLLREAEILGLVNKKAIEPAFNFYGIEAQSVLDKAGVLTALLVFYVIYTMWYGFAIFEIFDGIGLSMKKAKAKEEV
jgi:hypothetical protein